MAKGILGQKVGMTQIYDNAGNVIPVTVVAAGPCHVTQLRTQERDGYEAVQLGYLDKPRRLASRSERGHVAAIASKRSKARNAAGIEAPEKPNCEPKRFVREFRGPVEGYSVGQEIGLAELFESAEERSERLDAEQKEAEKAKKEKRHPKKLESNDKIKKVDITATSKGRGFAGVMKRHNFAGLRATHGTKKVHRHPGGTGQGTDPGRTLKGTRLAGQYGNVKVTTRNLEVVGVDPENNILLIKGAVPGPNGGMLVISQTNFVGSGG